LSNASSLLSQSVVTHCKVQQNEKGNKDTNSMPGEIRDFQAETPSSSIGEEHKSFSESDTDSQILMGHYIEQLVGKHSTA